MIKLVRNYPGQNHLPLYIALLFPFFLAGSLFTGFFDYYLNQFDFTADVASVRLGTKLTNDECLDYAKERSIGELNAFTVEVK